MNQVDTKEMLSAAGSWAKATTELKGVNEELRTLEDKKDYIHEGMIAQVDILKGKMPQGVENMVLLDTSYGVVMVKMAKAIKKKVKPGEDPLADKFRCKVELVPVIGRVE